MDAPNSLMNGFHIERNLTDDTIICNRGFLSQSPSKPGNPGDCEEVYLRKSAAHDFEGNYIINIKKLEEFIIW